MAEKAEKKSEAGAHSSASVKAAAKESKGGAGGMLTKTPVLLGGVMVVEAAALLIGFHFLAGRPQQASAAELAKLENSEGKGAKNAEKSKSVEVPVADFKALNRANGRTFLYDVSIYVTTKPEYEQRITDAFKENKALIEDRIRTIVAESDPEKLGGGSEPGLETLRRQIKYQLDGIVGEGIIDQVLVPRCIPFRTDY